MIFRSRGRPETWKGAVAGAIAGVAASGAMNLFQFVWNALAARRGPAESPPQETEDATTRAATAISEGVLHRRLTPEAKRIGASVVHYAFGSSVGALYGAVAESHPEVTRGRGLPFGVVFWLVADEMAVPALGLSRPATSYPVSIHLYALASHLVFGAVTEATRRGTRSILR